MNKPPKLTDEEMNEFRQAMRGVSRFKNNSPPNLETNNLKRKRLQKKEPTDQLIEPPLIAASDAIFTGSDNLEYAQSGVQHKVLRRLRQGKFKVQAYLDLHRMTSKAAYNAMLDFIENCQQHDYRWICIIHGKGYHSKAEPIIKNALNQWLRENENVLAFHTAKPQHGGTGAVYVLLKSKP